MRNPSVTAILGTVLGIVGIIAAYVSNSRLMGALFNADAIQMPAVFADLFERGGSFSDWTIAPAPAIVPEYGLYAVAYIVGVNLFGRVLVYSILQIATLWILLFALARVVGVKNAVISSSLTVTIMSLFCMLNVQNFFQLVQSAFHFGGFLMQLILLILVLSAHRVHQRRRRIAFIAGIGLLVVVGSFNDALFIIQAVVPLVIIVLAGVALRRIAWREAVIFTAVVVPCSYVGLKLYSRLMPHPVTNVRTFDPSGAGNDLTEFGSYFGMNEISLPVVVTLFLLTCVLGVSAVFLLVKRPTTPSRLLWTNQGSQVLAVVALLGTATSIGAMLLTSAEVNARYALPLYYWPCILVPMIMVELRIVWMNVAAAVASLALGVASTGLGVSGIVNEGLHADYYPTWEQCIDSAAENFHVSHALGTYWVTKPVQELSRSGITVTNVPDVQSQQFWIASSKNQFDSYDAFIDKKKNPTPEYLDLLIKIAGKPVKTVKCDRVTMTIWAPGSIAAADLIQK